MSRLGDAAAATGDAAKKAGTWINAHPELSKAVGYVWLGCVFGVVVGYLIFSR